MYLPFPEIATTRLMLRQFSEDDLHNIYNGLSNPIVYRYYGVRFLSLEETKKQIEFYKGLEKNKTGIWWAICLQPHMTFIGAAGFNNYQETHKKIEIGFWLLPDFWGKGYLHEAASKICEFAFSKIKVHRIEAFVESENKKSESTLLKLGFELEGRMRDCEIKDNRFINLDIFAKLNT